MPSTKPFRDRVLGLLLPFGPVQARGMFGGFGLYLDGTMFALIANDSLYVKFDDSNRALFAEAGGHPFTYDRRGKMVEMSYWLVPPAVMTDPQRLCDWAESSLRVAKSKPRRRK
jgi:DNA transformation protein